MTEEGFDLAFTRMAESKSHDFKVTGFEYIEDWIKAMKKQVLDANNGEWNNKYAGVLYAEQHTLICTGHRRF